MPITFSALWDNHPNVSGDDNPCRKPNGDAAYDNECAIRIGIAFAKCGYDVSKLHGAVFCSYHPKSAGHILRAEELANVLARTHIMGGGRMIKVTPSDFARQLKGKTGIIFFKDFWRRGRETLRNRSGDHIDLWNGNRITSRTSYFRIHWGISIPGIFSDLYASKEIWFWPVI